MKSDDERRASLIEVADLSLEAAGRFEATPAERASAMTAFRLAREGLNFVPPVNRFPNYTPCPACGAPVEKGTQGHRITGCPSKSRHAWTLDEIRDAWQTAMESRHPLAALDPTELLADWKAIETTLLR